MPRTLALGLTLSAALSFAGAPAARAFDGAGPVRVGALFAELSQLSGVGTILVAEPSGAPEAARAKGLSEAQLRALIGRHDGVVSAPRVQELLELSGWSMDELLLALLPIAKDVARPQVSGYKVSAALLGGSGAIYFGGNLSFIGVPNAHTAHAEQAAVANARAHGETVALMLAVTDVPCGSCREFLHELRVDAALRILVPGLPPKTLADLLPHGYVYPASVSAGLLEGSVMTFVVPPGSDAPSDLVEAAARSARASHSKYAASGVALRLADGRIVSGEYLEVAAGNPSLPPLQSALVRLVAEGYAYDLIQEAVLVELEGARVVQAGATAELMRRVAPRARLHVVLGAR
jgi:cytidine deaminase